ncbi:aspartate kinase [Maritalea mediterranea]|uniref:Aspartokinase n=1 Tax=Maritalea mediterranea TaxID=2909667 RepID=A0ABS9EBG7_9HYPH|nr:aspartate kinase [Maritalea mediterranea]MCF4099504.1 aspartate kinase [Maritalea mediterranea]
MATIVMKFGGTSVADIERIRHAARHVKREVDAGHKVCVVVSAMSGKTNELVALTRDAAPVHDAREYDAVVASGEQVSAGLMSIVLQEMGVPARSFAGWQVPIETSDAHGSARITNIDPALLFDRMNAGLVCVVTGFQGVSPHKRITTLGRGGSDTSAVAVAAAVQADRCDIYTDVDGVYTTDPRIVSKARRIERISFEEMLEMASLGAKVLQTRSVELAMAKKVRLVVRSSFDDPDQVPPLGEQGDWQGPGTLVCDEDEIMEKQIVSGVTCAKSEAKITLRGVKDNPGVAAAVFGPLADAQIVVDMIVQNISDDGKSTDITFTIPDAEFDKAMTVLKEAGETSLEFDSISGSKGGAKISVIGVGMRSHAGVAASMFRALSDKGINIQLITTSEIKTSVLIEEEYAELAVRALHTYYGLDMEEA